MTTMHSVVAASLTLLITILTPHPLSSSEHTPGGPDTRGVPVRPVYAGQQAERDSWMERLRTADPENSDKNASKLRLNGAAEAVAACESGARLDDGSAEAGTHDWEAQNSRSSASGAFQFIDGTWHWVWRDLLGEDAPTGTAGEATPEQQLTAFTALWQDGDGSRHWSESQSCWQQMLS